MELQFKTQSLEDQVKEQFLEAGCDPMCIVEYERAGQKSISSAVNRHNGWSHVQALIDAERGEVVWVCWTDRRRDDRKAKTLARLIKSLDLQQRNKELREYRKEYAKNN